MAHLFERPVVMHLKPDIYFRLHLAPRQIQYNMGTRNCLGSKSDMGYIDHITHRALVHLRFGESTINLVYLMA